MKERIIAQVVIVIVAGVVKYYVAKKIGHMAEKQLQRKADLLKQERELELQNELHGG